MPKILLEALGLTEPTGPSADSYSGEAKEFRNQFTEALKPINENLRVLVSTAPPVDHEEATGRRDDLIAAFQAVVKKQDEALPSKETERVLAAARALGKKTSSQAAKALRTQQQWTQLESDYDETLSRIVRLDEAEHPQAEKLRKVCQEIEKRAALKQFSSAVSGLEQIKTKLPAEPGPRPSEESTASVQDSVDDLDSELLHEKMRSITERLEKMRAALLG